MLARLRSLPRAIVLLAITSFSADVATEMLYPVLPLFLTEELHAPRSAVGIVEGVAEATQNLVQAASGWLADRTGRSKPIAIAGYALAALAKPTIGLATAWPGVLASRFADRFGTGLRSAPRDALIAGSVEERRRGLAFGLEGIGDNLGAVVGPLIAAGLLYLLQVPLRSVFFLAFVPAAIAVALVSTVPDPRPAGPARRGRPPLPAPSPPPHPVPLPTLGARSRPLRMPNRFTAASTLSILRPARINGLLATWIKRALSAGSLTMILVRSPSEASSLSATSRTRNATSGSVGSTSRSCSSSSSSSSRNFWLISTTLVP